MRKKIPKTFKKKSILYGITQMNFEDSKSITEGQMLCDSTYMSYIKSSDSGTGSSVGVARRGPGGTGGTGGREVAV